jgi:tRNA 2-thiouridine synthesizing protein A
MAEKELDLRNELCPRPMIMVMSTIKTLDRGDLLNVKTTDPTTKEAIPKLCERAGFTLLEMTEEEGEILFSIRK